MKSVNRSQTVLIIDDDQDIVRASHLRLRAKGYQTEAAFDGAAGLEMVNLCRPDLVLLDVRMPKMDGIRVLQQLKSSGETKRIPVVMVSASIVDQDAALESGAAFFVRKPYSSESFIAAIESAIKGAAKAG